MFNRLFEPGKIRNLEIKNRIIMSALHLGYTIDEEVDFYRERAKGGAGLIVTVAGANEEGALCNMPLINDFYKAELKRLVGTVEVYGCKMFVQLFHAGHNGAKGMMKKPDIEPVAPSSIPSPLYRYMPREMTLEDIERTIADFGKSARLCRDGGAHGVEISCSAGYLLTQFLSPLTNKREDGYGGSEENRWRFPMKVIAEVRKAVGDDYPVSLRLSASDMLGGYSLNDMCRFVSAIPEGQVDIINVTGGWHEAPVPQIVSRVPEGGFSYLAGEIKKSANIPVVASNRINSGEAAEAILEKGLADFVGCARPFITDADFANKVQKGIPYRKCIACNKGCIDRSFKLDRVCCILNPESGFERIKVTPVERPEKILVIGGGVTGMEAAKYLAMQGHDVTICTNEGSLGGLIHVASKPPYKESFEDLVDAMKHEIDELGVKVLYGTEADREFVKNFSPDRVYVATGSRPRIPPLEGINSDIVTTAQDVLLSSGEEVGKMLAGKTVIIGGGAVGLETAHFLADHSMLDANATKSFIAKYVEEKIGGMLTRTHDITVIEMQEKAGKDLGGNRWIAIKELADAGVRIMTGTKVRSISNSGICVERDGESEDIAADHIVLALGYRSNSEKIVKMLDELGYKYEVIGDAQKVGTVYECLKSAFNTVAGN